MQNEQSELEREISMMPLREPSLDLDRRVFETISQASSVSSASRLTHKDHPSHRRLIWMVAYAIAATVLVAVSYSLGFRDGIAAEKESIAFVKKTVDGTPKQESIKTGQEEIHQEPSLEFQEFLTSKQDKETIWGSKETLARFETKVIYPTESKEGM